MGTPVSKSAENSVSELDAGSVFYKEDAAAEGNIDTSETGIGETASTLDSGESMCAPNTFLNPVVHEDDDTDDKQIDDIYNRLKTDRSEDLHNVNTRFNGNGLSKPSECASQDTDANPVCSSAIAERQTRLNSENFSPHAVALRRENTKIESSNLPEDCINENETKESVDPKEHPETNDVSLESADTRVTDETATSIDTTAKQTNCLENNEEFRNRKESIGRKALTTKADVQYLGLPCADGVCFSPTPRSRSGSMHSDSDVDPMDGLEIPRNRVYSIGSASVYSVKEMSDELYKQYMEEIKGCIRSYGFFEAFPSPSIVAEAQKLCRQLEMPSPVDEDGNVLPHPSKIRVKSFMTADVESVNKISDKIMKIPAAMQRNSQTVDIVNYLCQGIDDDAYKLKMLLGWLVYQHQKSDTEDTTDDHWLKRLRALCKFARLKTRAIKGVVRGPSYMPGDDIEPHRGSWMAILVNHAWVLVDPMLSLPKRNKQKASSSNKQNVDTFSQTVLELLENLFQDPEQFIFSHFPDEEHWQLLARPVTIEELALLSLVRPAYFNLGLTLLSNGKSTAVIESSETTMCLSFPDGLKPRFKCTFHICDKSFSDVRMRNYVFLETRFDDNKVNLVLRFPKKSSYLLNISVTNGTSDWKNILTTKFRYKGPDGVVPFPDNPREEWGPGLDTERLGLEPKSHLGGKICIQRGIVQVVFGDERNLQYQHVLFRQDLKIDPNSLKVNILKDKNNDVIFVVDIDNKIQGIFTLQLSVREDKRSEYKTFCTYLIKKEKMAMVPKLEFNQSKDTDKKTSIKVPETGQLQLTVPASGLIQLSVELKFHDRQELNLSEHARHWICGDQGFIDLNFPRKGEYSLNVLGREVVKGKLIPLLQGRYTADVPSERWSCFPKEGSYWNSWYKIETPLSHHLEEKETIAFTVDVRNAHDVAVLAANGWYHLERVEENEENWMWTGQVWTGPKSTRCQLLARFEVGSDKWSDLLWFKVMSDDDYERMGDRQKSAIELAKQDAKPGTIESVA